MKNLTLITSVIDTPDIPLSYTNTRSVFTREQRFAQLKNTIITVRQNIPDNHVFLVECSRLTDAEREFLTGIVHYFLNIYETQNQPLIDRMFTPSKAMGEGTMTILALQQLATNNIKYDNFYKISGRYWLNNNFFYEIFDNSYSCTCPIDGDNNGMLTSLYKLTYDHSLAWLEYLKGSESLFARCVGYEVIFGAFVNSLDIKKRYSLHRMGVSGYISVCGTYVEK